MLLFSFFLSAPLPALPILTSSNNKKGVWTTSSSEKGGWGGGGAVTSLPTAQNGHPKVARKTRAFTRLPIKHFKPFAVCFLYYAHTRYTTLSTQFWRTCVGLAKTRTRTKYSLDREDDGAQKCGVPKNTRRALASPPKKSRIFPRQKSSLQTFLWLDPTGVV